MAPNVLLYQVLWLQGDLSTPEDVTVVQSETSKSVL